MASSKEHYERVLSPVYSWMYGGHDAALERNRSFFADLELAPRGSRRAVDLGAGSGFQSIPLAELGYDVVGIDLDRGLLDELEARAAGLPIRTVEGDLTELRRQVDGGVELAVCMTDTILHLDSAAAVARTFAETHATLEPGGRLILTFRDLTTELADLDRFIPVRSDDDTIFTCFLEYEPETVKVHDLVYRRRDEGWELSKSFYRKLRLSREWVDDALRRAGFGDAEATVDKGLITVIATRA